MNFRVWGALGIAALVLAPLFAHLLRRRPPEEQPFAGTRLVPESPAITARRTALEDRSLFALRALAVLALAVLGATPLFRCARLSLARQSGASVALAIVLDDSLSMRAQLPGKKVTRFARAVEGAKELLGTMQPGDAVAIVLAGRPVRVALAATSNLDAVRQALDAVEPSDRGTDIDGAVRVASELIRGLEHVDKRVILLGDLEDEAGAKLTLADGVKVWAPLTELKGPLDDCGVIHADRNGSRITVRVACTRAAVDSMRLFPAAGSRGASDTATPPAGSDRMEARSIGIFAGTEKLIGGPLHVDALGAELGFTLPDTALEKYASTQLYVVLSGGDALPEDDVAPIVSQSSSLHAAVVIDPSQDRVPTGGASLVEQAFHSLELGVQLAPMPTIPEQSEELSALALLIVDDPAGFTPAERGTLSTWVERGGVLFLALGRHASAAPLGSGFSPLLPALVRWRPSPVKGLSRRGDALFADAGDGLDDLAPAGRAVLELESGVTDVHTLARWEDDAPFVVERRLGRGVAVSMTLPLSSQESDFGLRPALFSMLERVVHEAQQRFGTGRTLVGAKWSMAATGNATARRLERGDQGQALAIDTVPTGREFVPGRAGLHELVQDGATTMRVAELDEREFRTVQVELPPEANEGSLGGTTAQVDFSPQVALFLLALLAAELAVRAAGRRLRRGGVPVADAPHAP